MPELKSKVDKGAHRRKFSGKDKKNVFVLLLIRKRNGFIPQISSFLTSVYIKCIPLKPLFTKFSKLSLFLFLRRLVQRQSLSGGGWLGLSC